ncbi:hypothetical protein UFOVP528_7 [uncultured Caudovirales phage]|uniref:Uncharacterized protein n=1 Tax=uncultured Caudovirales phage TaxID=2100421 RepID=A0A6J5MRS5_9CAUD|nr:hypothetical protein UFOVP528_7 [uncultured Caudovirales phage]
MAKSTAAIEIEVLPKNGADTKVGNFKQQLREAKLEAQQMVITFGEFSDQALAAQKRVADLSDRMDDFNDRVKALNPDRFAKVQTIVQGVSSGFAAAQGAMALFGSESQDLTKTLVKVQGAMALASGLEGLGKIQQQFSILAKDGIAAVTKAFSTLRGAIISTGFGALVIALGYVLTNLEKFGLVSDSVADKVKKLQDANDKMITSLSEGLKSQELEISLNVLKGNNTLEEAANQKIEIIKKQNAEIEEQMRIASKEENRLRMLGDQIKTDEDKKAENDLRKHYLKLNDITQENEIKILELNAEVSKQKEENRKKEEEENQKRLDKIKEQNKIEQNLLIERNNAQRQLLVDRLKSDTDILNQQYQNNLTSLREQQRKELLQENLTTTSKQYINQKYLALKQSITEKYNKDLVAVNKKTEDEIKANRDKFIEAELAATQKQYQQQINFIKLRDKDLTDQTNTNQEIADKELKSLEDQLLTKQKFEEDTTAIEQQILDKKRAIRDTDLAEEEKKAAKEKEIQTAKFQAINDSLNAIADIYSAFASSSEEDQKKAFEVNKAAQIAQAIVNTYQGVTAALTSVPLFPGQQFINAGLALATGIAAVKKISDTQFESKSVNGSKPSQQSGQGTMQSFAPRMSSLGLNDNLTQTQRVYVTEGDITRTQRRVSNNKAISVVE